MADFTSSIVDVARLPGEAYPRPARSGAPAQPESASYWPEAFLFRHPRFPAVVQHVRQEDIVLHQHEFVELVLVEKGMARHWLPRRSQMLAAGDTFLVAGPQVHGEFAHLLGQVAPRLFGLRELAFQFGHEAPLLPQRGSAGGHACFAGTCRKIWMVGSSSCRTSGTRPISMPSGNATISASAKPP